MSNLLALTKWLPKVRMIKYDISSLQVTFQTQQIYLNSLCTFSLCISYFKYLYLGAACGSPYIVFISTSGMLHSSDIYIYIYIHSNSPYPGTLGPGTVRNSEMAITRNSPILYSYIYHDKYLIWYKCMYKLIDRIIDPIKPL